MTENQVELETSQIVLPSIDISPYVGKKVKVASVKEFEGNFGYYIRVETETVATLEQKDKEGNAIIITGSRIFGLQTDAEGKVGWGEKTKLGNYIKKMKVNHYKDLVGKEVQLTSVTNENDGKDYLSFN